MNKLKQMNDPSKKAKTSKPFNCKGYCKSTIIDEHGNHAIQKCNRGNDDACNGFCKFHQYMKNYTTEQINSIKNDGKGFCNRCRRFKLDIQDGCKRCDECVDVAKIHGKKMREVRSKNKCTWKDKHLNPCRGFSINNTSYCKNHQYVAEYTNAQKTSSIKCSGCNKIKYMNGLNTCQICRDRRNNKKLQKIAKKNNVFIVDDCTNEVKKCNHNGCNFKAKTNGYCGNHQLIKWKLDIEESGSHKVCGEYKRGCRMLLKKMYMYSRCDDCREKERIKDKEHRDKVRELNNVREDGKKQCIKCRKFDNEWNFFTDSGKKTNKCRNCYYAQCKVEKNRGKRERNYSEYDARPEVKERKTKWKDDNWDKIRMYDMNYKQRQADALGDKYWENRAAYAKERRRIRKENGENIYGKNKLNIKYKYGYYKREAFNKGRCYELTFIESKKMFVSDCHYCGSMAFEGIALNGIDRKNNNIGYTKDNCVPCCTMCNMMKGYKLDDVQFINVCEHILTNLGLIDGKLYPECFRDGYSGNWSEFINTSKKRKKKVLINEVEFSSIKSKKCYLCGKENSVNHINGIDRVFNDIGYLYPNCKGCCSTCNYLKRDYPLIDCLIKLSNIYSNTMDKNTDNDKLCTKYFGIIKTTMIKNKKKGYLDEIKKAMKAKEKTKNFRRRQRASLGEDKYKEKMRYEKAKQRGRLDADGNIIERIKLTTDEKRERERLRKQEQRKRTREKMGDETYKQMMAQKRKNERMRKKTRNTLNT
jgi:hypothetical protein